MISQRSAFSGCSSFYKNNLKKEYDTLFTRTIKKASVWMSTILSSPLLLFAIQFVIPLLNAKLRSARVFLPDTEKITPILIYWIYEPYTRSQRHS